MNRDVKIGLAIGLLVLVALFVWLAWKASREPNPVADISRRAPVKTTGPEITTNTQTPARTIGPSAKDYFAPEETARTPETGEIAKGPEPRETATVEVGIGGTKSTEELTPAARAYRELIGKKTGETPAKTTGIATKTTGPGTMTTDISTRTPESGVTAETFTTPASYVVKEGETLGIVSKKVYGSSRFWQRIAKANKIDDPARVRAGIALTIPPLSETERPHGATPLKGKGKETAKETFPTGPTAEQHHKVVFGDTLGTISQQYYGTSRQMKLIMQANKLTDENKLRVGQVLVIPKVSTASSGASAGHSAVGGEYVVKDGDTLSSISQQFYGTPTLYLAIMKANKIDNGRDVLMGQKLIIPPKPTGEETADVTPRHEGLLAKTSMVAKTDLVARTDKGLTGPKLEPGEETYVVEEGDTLGDIAAHQLGSARDVGLLMKRNNITNDNQVRVGQVLVIPSRTTLHILSSEAREANPR